MMRREGKRERKKTFLSVNRSLFSLVMFMFWVKFEQALKGISVKIFPSYYLLILPFYIQIKEIKMDINGKRLRLSLR